MKKDITSLPGDLYKKLQADLDRAKKVIAREALTDAASIAPKYTGFLSTQGAAYVDGAKVAETPHTVKPVNGRVYHSFAETEDSGTDIAIEFVAKKRSKKRTFDYAYYVGVINPKYLKNPMTQFWIDQALHPKKVILMLKRHFKVAK